jgi:uncharacterized protein (TIGR03118 family)
VNNIGAATLYTVSNTGTPTAVKNGLTVAIPNQNGAPPNPNATGPTGEVSTGAPGITTVPTDFVVGSNKAAFIFANVDGSISGWNGGASATIMTPVPGASFTGLAIGNTMSGAAQLYAADQNSPTGNIDIINNKWQLIGSMTDPNFSRFPSGYAAFNVQNLIVNGVQTLFVTYANQSTGGGIVDEFTPDGTFIKTLINDTGPNPHLNAPWGLTIAPASFGQFGGDLLVGNNNEDANGLTTINAYTLGGVWQGTLTLQNGQPFSAEQLWAISFGNGASGGSQSVLYFTAGLDNNTNGLIGAISSVPEPSSVVLGLIATITVGGVVVWKKKARWVAS